MKKLYRGINLANRSRGIAASFIFACIKFLWRKFRWAWLRNGFAYDRVTSAVGKLPSDTRTLISHWEKFAEKLVKFGGL